MTNDDDSTTKRFQAALLASVVLHLVCILSLRPSLSTAVERRVEVELVSVPLPQKQPVKMQEKVPEQMVAPSDTKDRTPPKETRLRSEHDSYAERETLRRGDPLVRLEPPRPEPPRPEPPQKQTPKPPAPKPPASKPEPKPEPEAKELPDPSQLKLRLNDTQIARTIGETPPKAPKETGRKAEKTPDRERAQKFEQTQPFQSQSASLFRGNYGNADHLPDIPDGDITLLNAKADRYAVFVRRVALQVFGALRKLNWQELSRSELASLGDFVLVEAVMDKKGKLISVQLRERSGSEDFDKIAKRAAELGTWDQNPPADAADADGNIHFIFKARSWSRSMQSGMSEQRWLLLGTGLL